MSHPVLSHVAFLARSVERAAAPFRTLGHPVGPAAEWEGEGTLEIYVGGSERSAQVLLMEPVKAGAYERAMKKRGPGLHHLGIDVLDAEAYALQLARVGWLLHPRSLETFRKTRTLWLARPGIPTLLEVQQKERLVDAPAFVTRAELPVNASDAARVQSLGLAAVRAGEHFRFEIESGEVPELALGS